MPDVLRRLRTVAAVDPDEPARAKDPLLAAEIELDLTVDDEVELLLALVVVRVGLPVGRQHDRVHAELGHAQRAADLAEARPFAETVDGCNRPPAALFGTHRTAY